MEKVLLLTTLLVLVAVVEIRSQPYARPECRYDKKTNILTMKISVTPGISGIYKIVLYDTNKNEDRLCRTTAPTIDGTYELAININTATGAISENCNTGYVIKDPTDEIWTMRIYVRQLEKHIIAGDHRYILKCSPDNALKTSLTSDEVAINDLREEILDTYNAEMSLRVIEVTTSNIVRIASIYDKVRLLASMKIPNTNVGAPVGIHVFNCEAGPTLAFASGTTKMLNEKGCPLQAMVFQMTEGFHPYTTSSLYDIENDGNGIYFLAVSNAFRLAKFPNYPSVSFRCEVDFCYSTSDVSCFGNDQCIGGGRRKRESLKNRTTVSTSILVTTNDPTSSPIVDNDPDDGTLITEHDCFPSWIFVVVVVVLVLLLVFAVLVSFCILYRLNRKNYDQDEKF